MTENSENKNAKISVKKVFDEFRAQTLPNIASELANLKAKARELFDAVSKKREAFAAKLNEEEKAAMPKEAEKKTSQTPATKTEAPVAEVKKEEVKPVEEKKETVEAKPKTNTNVPHRTFAIEPEKKKPDYSNEPRRIYIPPEKKAPEKKVQTRVFDNTTQQRQPRPQNAANQGTRPMRSGPKPQGGYVAPAVIMPNKNQPKTKKNAYTGDEKNAPSKYDLKKSGQIGRFDNYNNFKGTTIDDNADEIFDNTRVRNYKAKKSESNKSQAIKIESATVNSEVFSIKHLSEKIGKTGTEIIKKLFSLDIIKTINENIDFETASLVASDFGIKLELKLEKTFEDALTEQNLDTADSPESLVTRPPIVTIMGHVDHGKTSLLDYIRKSKVATGEAGGITQQIGAYTIKIKGQQITFIDTPGHEAFTAMRARGAQVTDIAVLVVAADDGIMPQTIEAIDHAKSAGVEIIVAVNKIDKAGADPQKVLQQLTEHDLLPEEWGGSTPVCNVSAKTGEGVDHLLETVLLVAELLELKANPDRKAKGTIIESKLDKGLGAVATVLVEKGTLKVGDAIIAGTAVGKIKTMTDENGRQVKSAGPSTPVVVSGFDEVPNAGDILNAVDDDKFARQLAEERRQQPAVVEDNTKKKLSLEDFTSKDYKETAIIFKADTQGSLEALKYDVLRFNDMPDYSDVKVKIIHGGVGAINESDVMLAKTTGAIIFGFGVRPDSNAKSVAEAQKVDIYCCKVIYEILDRVQKAMKGLLDPVFEEVVLGTAEVRETFNYSKVGTIAGCYVLDGKILRSAKVRVIRNGVNVFEGMIDSLKHGKDDAKEMAKGFECGIKIQNFNDVKKGDIIEAFKMEQVKQ